MTTNMDLLKLLKLATRRFSNFKRIGEQARERKVKVVLHPLEWWEPKDEALLKEMLQVVNQHGGLEPLPLEAAATADDEEVVNE